MVKLKVMAGPGGPGWGVRGGLRSRRRLLKSLAWPAQESACAQLAKKGKESPCQPALEVRDRELESSLGDGH